MYIYTCFQRVLYKCNLLHILSKRVISKLIFMWAYLIKFNPEK